MPSLAVPEHKNMLNEHKNNFKEKVIQKGSVLDCELTAAKGSQAFGVWVGLPVPHLFPRSKGDLELPGKSLNKGTCPRWGTSLCAGNFRRCGLPEPLLGWQLQLGGLRGPTAQRSPQSSFLLIRFQSLQLTGRSRRAEPFHTQGSNQE